jgi:glycosyltransferase involved in cell wall biosynthesis
LNLQDRIQILGACFQADVTKLYDWCQVLVLSSRSEGTPMVIIEAMAKARPVIAPRLTAIPEMVAEGQTGYLFQPGDASDLAAKLNRLMAQPQDLVRLGLEGRQRALELFDLNRNARKMMAVFARELPWVPGCHEVAAV